MWRQEKLKKESSQTRIDLPGCKELGFCREGNVRKYAVTGDQSKETALAIPQFAGEEDGTRELRFGGRKSSKKKEVKPELTDPDVKNSFFAGRGLPGNML